MTMMTVTAPASAPAAPVGSAAARPAARRRGIVARLWSAFTTLLLVTGIASLLFMTVGPRVLHYRTATMLTGSMVPTINPGDVVLDTQEATADIAVGQIITYRIPIDDHRVESHRVIWVRHGKDGVVAFRTKGDANTAPDPWTAQINANDTPTVWRVRAVLPVVGSVIRALRQPVVHLLLAVALPAVLVLLLLLSIWRPSGSRPDAETEAGSAAGQQAAGTQRGRHRYAGTGGDA